MLSLLAVRSQAELWIIYLVAFCYGAAFTGAALISYVSYRVLLLAVIAAIGGCAAYLLARLAPEPSGDPPAGQGRAASTARCNDTSVSSKSGRASVRPARTSDRTSSVVAPESARQAS